MHPGRRERMSMKDYFMQGPKNIIWFDAA
jgi:hypothetical protein